MVNNVSFFSIKQTDTDLCHPNPCANGSPCFNTLGLLGGPDYYCLCQSHWQGKNCSRYRPPPPPPPPPSSPSLREFSPSKKKRKSYFVVVFFVYFSFPSFSFQFDSIHHAAIKPRHVPSCLVWEPYHHLAVLLGLLFTHRQKGFFPFLSLSLSRSLTHSSGVVKSTFDTQKLQILFFLFEKTNGKARIFSVVGGGIREKRKTFFFSGIEGSCPMTVSKLCNNYDGRLQREMREILCDCATKAHFGSLLARMMALLTSFFSFSYSIRLFVDAESCRLWWRIIQKNRKRKGAQRTSGIPQMTW
jgi:hypothetical protein